MDALNGCISKTSKGSQKLVEDLEKEMKINCKSSDCGEPVLFISGFAKSFKE